MYYQLMPTHKLKDTVKKKVIFPSSSSQAYAKILVICSDH